MWLKSFSLFFWSAWTYIVFHCCLFILIDIKQIWEYFISFLRWTTWKRYFRWWLTIIMRYGECNPCLCRDVKSLVDYRIWKPINSCLRLFYILEKSFSEKLMCSFYFLCTFRSYPRKFQIFPCQMCHWWQSIQTPLNWGDFCSLYWAVQSDVSANRVCCCLCVTHNLYTHVRPN